MHYLPATIADRLTEHTLLPLLLDYYLQSGNAITLWQMPHSSEKHLLICSDGLRHVDEISMEESETGFVFAPFDATQKKLFFKSDIIFTFHNGLFDSDNLPEEIARKFSSPVRRDEPIYPKIYPPKESISLPVPSGYRVLVQDCIDQIKIGSFEKIVPSRSKRFELPQNFELWKTFKQLSEAYPNCMISLVSSEETGTWMGATPELLASVDENLHFRTVALAGTKRYTPGMDLKSVAWTAKEIEEQAMVCRYIISCFKKIRLREYEEHGPRTAVAGNLLHLKTEFEVDMKATNFLQLGSTMLRLLHPTSAVCGMPLEPAREFLKNHEGYDRQFYSGFLGPINFRNESHLFVNLRCMQLDHHHAVLYAGAGVTIDSNPDKEWDETAMKMDTLLSIIR